MGNIDSINCKIIELPFQNKHLSMLILLPKDVEDGSTGLEQVRKEARAQHTGAIGPRGRCLWLLEVTRQPCLTGLLLSGLQGFLGSLGAFLFNIKTGNICLFGTYNVPGTVFPTCTGSSNSHRGPKSQKLSPEQEGGTEGQVTGLGSQTRGWCVELEWNPGSCNLG